MKPGFIFQPILAILLIQGFMLKTARADEGWWLFSDPPRKLLKERYRFEMTDAWLDRIRLASVRFVKGGSGSFVSHDGLILTNHHVVDDALHDMSTAKHDYVRNGFLALSRDNEMCCPRLERRFLSVAKT